jgi:hypothetical protein
MSSDLGIKYYFIGWTPASRAINIIVCGKEGQPGLTV